MITTTEKINKLRTRMLDKKIKIMIMGLGSVGTYLLDYIVSRNDDKLEVVVVGREYEKLVSDVNIVRVGALIRKLNKTNIIIESDVDFNNIAVVSEVIKRHDPDFIVNTSRVYSGLKYGSISWKNVRAYGIWTPLAVKYIKNIMEAYEIAGCEAVVINTSYSDAVNPWLKSAGLPYPDFGSGNLNHLLPRIKFMVAEKLNIKDFWNVKVLMATSHFHDVVISKEGQTEKMEQLLYIEYDGKKVDIPQEDIFAACKIPMPVDAKRNMMNASSNYDIIFSIIEAIRNKDVRIFESPGAFGEIGGYPVKIDGTKDNVIVEIDDSVFGLEEMRTANRKSIYYDGIENVENGVLTYSDELIAKVEKVFGEKLVKRVDFNGLPEVVDFLIEKIIKKSL